MKGWQALCWGGWQDSPSGLTPGKETFGENPPGQHLGLMAFKWGEYLIFTLARGDGGGEVGKACLLIPRCGAAFYLTLLPQQMPL